MAAVPVRDDESAEPTDRRLTDLLAKFDAAISEDLNTAVALTLLEEAAAMKKIDSRTEARDARRDGRGARPQPADDRACRPARVRPKAATIGEDEIEATLARRKDARAASATSRPPTPFATNSAAAGVEVMDGDPLGWDWRLDTEATSCVPLVPSIVETPRWSDELDGHLDFARCERDRESKAMTKTVTVLSGLIRSARRRPAARLGRTTSLRVEGRGARTRAACRDRLVR